MNKRFLVLFLFVISLFLLLSTVSAEDIGVDDSNVDFDVLSEDQPVDNSEDSNANANSDDSSDDTDDSANDINSNELDSSKTPYKFTSARNISSTYGNRVKFSVKVLNNEGKAINHTLVTFKVSGKTYNRYTNIKLPFINGILEPMCLEIKGLRQMFLTLHS